MFDEWNRVTYSLAALLVIMNIFMFFIAGIAISPGHEIVLVGGDSMEPTYPDECSFSIIDTNVNEDNVSEGDVVIFEPKYGLGKGTDYVRHRVIQKYENYNPQNAKYYISKEYTGDYVITDGMEYKSTNQTIQDMNNLSGDTVYVTQGDNNRLFDSELISEEQIVSNEIVYNQRLPFTCG